MRKTDHYKALSPGCTALYLLSTRITASQGHTQLCLFLCTIIILLNIALLSTCPLTYLATLLSKGKIEEEKDRENQSPDQTHLSNQEEIVNNKKYEISNVRTKQAKC